MQYANQHGYSDVTPYEIINWVSDKTIEVRLMAYKLDEDWKPEFHAGGFSAHCSNQSEQRYTYSSDEEEPIRRIRLHKNGRWFDKNGNQYRLSEKPRRFYDYNF